MTADALMDDKEATEYERVVREEFHDDIDNDKYHYDPRIRVVWCRCGQEHHAHIPKQFYTKLLKGAFTIDFDCGKADL